MLIGHVSDENYRALHDVAVEIGTPSADVVAVTRSTASGAVHADVAPGSYRVTLARDGYGAKHVTVDVAIDQPVGLRLLSDALTGYMWPKWVRSGDIGELRVHSIEPYRAELWRYGAVKERVELLGWFDEHGPRAMTQVLPDADFTQTGARFNSNGFTSAGHVRRVRAPERSGLYYVHLTTESGDFFSFPWIVAPATPSARFAVLAATNNWNAYNRFGGRSNYINEAGLPSTPTVHARLDLARYVHGNQVSQSAPDEAYPPLSFDRPDMECVVPRDVEVTDSMSGRLSSSLAPAFWRLLAWLEREGWDYDVYADHQLHDGTLDLDAYDGLILECHPEYWSRHMYERTKQWVELRGGQLAYLGGNGIDCEVEFAADGSAARYLTRQPRSEDPAEQHLESRFHRTYEAQAKLLGVTFTHAGEGTGAPYEVLDASHWVFDGAGVQKGDLIGRSSLAERVPGGASGWETDKVTPSAPDDVVVLAKGVNPDGGGAEMVYRELTGPGGAVFSAGSMTYVASLLVDDELSTVTSNVLRRFAEKTRVAS